jgi:hypothetical protein
VRKGKEEGGRGRSEEVLVFLFSVISHTKVYRRFVACCENRLFLSLVTFFLSHETASRARKELRNVDKALLPRLLHYSSRHPSLRQCERDLIVPEGTRLLRLDDRRTPRP